MREEIHQILCSVKVRDQIFIAFAGHWRNWHCLDEISKITGKLQNHENKKGLAYPEAHTEISKSL